MLASRRLEFPPYSLWETRAGSGTPVALIHGLSGSSRWWSRNLEVLSAKHLVAAVDLVGFGKNSRFLGAPIVSPPFSEVSALLARWLETFGEPVHLVGHSMGGQLAIRVAAEHPDLVRSLTLVNAAGMPFRFDPRPHLRSLPKPPYGGPGIARVLVPDFLRAGPTSVAIAGTRVVRADLRTMMHAIRVPTLLVWGANDPLVPLQYGEAMQREIADSRLEIIPRAAHVAMWDAPEAFNRLLLDFLHDVEGRAIASTAERLFSWGIAGSTPIVASQSMTHRQAGRRRDVVLVHGLGMSSAYLERFAAALFAHGWNPIAPDLLGFGESSNAPAVGVEEHAHQLAMWAEKLGIRDAVWIGHSIGCNVVRQLALGRPDLVRVPVFIGPLWTRSRWPRTRMFLRLALDAFREPLSLFRFVLPAYWRVGVARWWRTGNRYVPDVACVSAMPPQSIVIAGERDPLPDRACIDALNVPGAHACVYSHPEEVTLAIPAPEFRSASSVLPQS